ncbi:MAG: caspase family protein [Bradyrhizobium sp.]|uniref:caspase family protein n=1 Tax=Bradyrhizobium sp. TaxID=376 RepID=UPI0012295ABF|nr:caspase family protein [Bradyrhizobium sp.]THD67011.1 MAG: caspase family protein [Bradyrhizobium sp.]
MSGLRIFALVAIFFNLLGQPAFAEKRVALVIGNSDYQNVARLSNPLNDAAAMTATFKDARFDLVLSRHDLKASEMRRVLRDFADQVRDADVAVVYYAGHGIEVDGVNYLIPVDAALERDTDVYDEAFPLDRILVTVEPARKLRLIILDACRDNPFARTMRRTIGQRGIGRGLAKVEPASSNTMIAFAAKAGFTAFDGDGEYSPFATALAEHLTKPGLDLRKAFGFVRDDVLKATKNRQEPFVYGSLGGDDIALVPAPVLSAPVSPAPDPSDAIRRDYEFVERIATKEAWDFFLATHPDGYYAKLAQAQRNKLAAEEARVAATEKARSAEEEKARLAAEGAKAAEQAKAAADAKAAEQARLAAEKKKAEQEAKLAEAQRAAAVAEEARIAAENLRKIEEEKAAEARLVRIAEEAKAAAAKAKADEEARAAEARAAALQKALEDARIAEAQRTEAAARIKAEADHPIGPLASLSPADKPDETRPTDEQIPRLLQTELHRLGCYTGSVDGNWNDTTQHSLALFNKNAGTTLDTRVASFDTLDVLRHRNERVCPLICGHGYKADGDTCSRIVCKAGYEVGDDNTCERLREKKPTAKRERAPEETQPSAKRAPAGEPSYSGAGGAACGARSCSAAYAGCKRHAAEIGRQGYHCDSEYSSCLSTGEFIGRRCQRHGLAKN